MAENQGYKIDVPELPGLDVFIASPDGPSEEEIVNIQQLIKEVAATSPEQLPAGKGSVAESLQDPAKALELANIGRGRRTQRFPGMGDYNRYLNSTGLPESYKHVARGTGGMLGRITGTATGFGAGLASGPGAPVVSPIMALLGGEAGDVAGSAAGDAMFNVADDVYRSQNYQPPRYKEDNRIMGPIKSAGEAAYDSAFFGPLISSGVKAFGGPFKYATRRVLGIGDNDTMINALRRGVGMDAPAATDGAATLARKSSEAGGSGVGEREVQKLGYLDSIKNKLGMGAPKSATNIDGETYVPVQVGKETGGSGLGIMDVSPTAQKIIPAIAVLPFVGNIVRDHVVKVGKTLDNELISILDSVAPTTILNKGLTTPEVSKLWTKLAGDSYNTFNLGIKKLKETMFETSKSLGMPKVIPNTGLRKAAKKALKDIENARTTLEDGTVVEAYKDNPLVQQIRNFSKVEKMWSLEQYQGQMATLRENLKKYGGEGFDVSIATPLKEAMEQGLLNPSVRFGGKGAVDLTNQLRAWKTAFTSGIKKYETSTAKRVFKRHDRGIFGGYEQFGAKEADEIFESGWKPNSEEAMKHLEDVVGWKGVAQGLRSKMDEALEMFRTVDLAKGQVKFNLPAFKKSIGLDTETGVKNINHILSNVDVSPKLLNSVMDKLELMSKIRVPDMSTFLQRRVTLGGIGGLLSVSNFGSTGIVGAAATLYALRKGAKFLTDPVMLRKFTTAFDSSPLTTAKRQMQFDVLKQLQGNDYTHEASGKPRSNVKSEAVQATMEEPDLLTEVQERTIRDLRKQWNKLPSSLQQKALGAVESVENLDKTLKLPQKAILDGSLYNSLME